MLKFNPRTVGALLIACSVLGGCSTVPPPPEAPPLAQQLSPAEIDALGVEAEQAVARGAYPQAIALYEQAIAAAPRNAQALFRSGTVRLRVNDQRLAQYDFERALQADPAMSKAYANLAIVHLRQFRLSAERALAGNEISEANRATLRSLMRDVDRALHPPASLPPVVQQ